MGIIGLYSGPIEQNAGFGLGIETHLNGSVLNSPYGCVMYLVAVSGGRRGK